MEDQLCSLVKDLKVKSEQKSETHKESTSKVDGASKDHPSKEPCSKEQPSEEQIKQVPIANVEYYDMKDGQLIIMKENVNVYIHGIVSVCVLKGTVEILGYTLRPNELYRVHSPSGTAFLTISAVSTRENQSKSEASKSDLSKPDLSKLGLADKECEEVLTKITSCNVILACKFMSDPKIDFLMKHSLLKLLPSNKFKFKIQETNSNINVLTINKDWNDLIKNIRKPDGVFEKILIIGGNKCGKSSCYKYLANKLLMKFKEVLLINLDSAQPEFTISGMISATVVTEPLLGPNYSHIKTPNCSVFVGIIDIGYKPFYYLNCVKKLMELCEELPKMPIVIQTNGFTDNKGINIAASIIGITKADRVAEFYNNYRGFNEPLTVETVTKKKQLYTKDEIIKPFVLHRIKGAEIDDKQLIDSKLLRVVRIMCYFKDILNSHRFGFNVIQSNRRFSAQGLPVGQLIAVCRKTNGNDIYECLGWAIINKIDERSFTVMSPCCILEGDSKLVFMLPDYSVVAPSTFYQPIRTSDKLNIRVASNIYKPFNFHWISERSVAKKRHSTSARDTT